MNKTILSDISSPDDLKSLNDEQLAQLSHELRDDVIRIVSETGGHLGAGLGVIELTVALHHVFNTPRDKIIWDVGHQAYPHKILTGRRDQMHTLRTEGGLSGFTKRSESTYDPFGAGHSSTSISAALGMAVARDKKGEDNEVIAVIGDGAMSAGMAYEALNNAGAIDSKLIVILNDNDMSIAPAVGAMSGYLSKLISSKSYLSFRDIAKKAVSHLPSHFERGLRKTEQYAKHLTSPDKNFFEELGFYYIGPIDGHNMEHLLPVLRNVRDSKKPQPVLIHAVTEKGHGFDSPEASNEKFHAVKTFDVATRVQKKGAPSGVKTYTQVFAEQLIKDAEADERIVAITAAMPSGTGLNLFEKAFPERTYDVGIAEQHAVTFAAGMACEGYKPFCTIYSTFLQRAYDQVVHDVAIQNLPVRFAIDRAGLVGADGATHAGSFDVTYLATLPNFVVMAASDEHELARMVKTASLHDDGPIAFRYPRGNGVGIPIPDHVEPLRIGKGRYIQRGNEVAIVNFGARLLACKSAASQLQEKGLSVSIFDARFAKPLDSRALLEMARSHKVMLTIEEGSIGGFGSHVVELLTSEDALQQCRFKAMHLPDVFQNHASQDRQYEEAGLDAEAIVKEALARLPREDSHAVRAEHSDSTREAQHLDA